MSQLEHTALANRMSISLKQREGEVTALRRQVSELEATRGLLHVAVFVHPNLFNRIIYLLNFVIMNRLAIQSISYSHFQAMSA